MTLDASHSRSCACPTTGIGRAASIPRAGSFRDRRSTTTRSGIDAPLDTPLGRAPSAARSTDPERAIARRPSSRSSTTSTEARRSRCGAPLIDGAGWWAEAFEAAGFVDAFRVELMPEGATPPRRPLQRDPVGPPLDTRLVVRRRRRRPANGRDDQGARLAWVRCACVRIACCSRGSPAPIARAAGAPDDPIAARARTHPPARGARGGAHARALHTTFAASTYDRIARR